MRDAPYRLAIIGWPVAHSRSPLIHNYWLAKYALDGTYEPYPIDPKDDFKARLNEMAEAGFTGANVTIPHKEAAFAAMDELSPTAQILGAVNTIIFRNGKLIGDNTDGDGFLAGLDMAARAAGLSGDWRDKPALVLGAGGAARAIVAALGRRHVPEIRLLNRTREKAEALAHLAANITIDEWDERAASAQDCALLVNTTSLGMHGQPALEMPLEGLCDKALVSDIVYTPLKTLLLKSARAQGHIAVDGLGMLMHQAALSFAMWTGQAPAADDSLRAHLLADLAAERKGEN